MKFTMKDLPQGVLTNDQLLMIKGGNDHTDGQDTVIQDTIIG